MESLLGMPILINGQILKELPSDTENLFTKYPFLKETARALICTKPTTVNPLRSLFVSQREFAVVSLEDKCIDVLGTDDTTTCCSVILRHIGSGVVALAHFDGSGLNDGVASMVKKVMDYSKMYQGYMEVHMIGGFLDDNDYSKDLAIKLLDALHSQPHDLHLVTACICEINNVERLGNNWPVVYGVAIDVKSGQIFSASFRDRGPEISLRSARLYAGLHDMVDIYDTMLSMVEISPFCYKPMRGIELWLEQPDDVIRKHMSTSPLVEPPHFADHVKNALAFIHANPFPELTLFSNNRSHYYRQSDSGLWELQN
ncbi:Protein N-terminal asparagine amidohydrolase [Halotydeus destructor]|nr:Protein N-terminal asparagine amidohydrolase [Halotydeus destructor]